nr:MAG TPA: hypothetical protein [Microviridae sp.]
MSLWTPVRNKIPEYWQEAVKKAVRAATMAATRVQNFLDFKKERNLFILHNFTIVKQNWGI